MNPTTISLAIFGNQNSNSGFQPLYWINDPPQQLENIVPPGMDENPYFFTLQTLPAHTQFTLIHNRVSSYMSSRAGVLKMAITLPKGYRISGGFSPLDVLLEVRKKFVDTCMTPRDAHSEAYNFKEKLADPDIFAAIVDAYQLEPDPQPHLPMTGTDDALLLLDDAAIAQLFIAPQRPEFTRFRRIVVANKGNASVYKTISEADIVYAAPAQVARADNSHANDKNFSPDRPVVFKTEREEKNMATTTPQKSYPWKRHLPLLLLPLLIGGAVFWLMNTSSSSSSAFADDDNEVAEEEVDLIDNLDETDTDECSTQEKMEQAIKDAYIATTDSTATTRTIAPTDMPRRQDTGRLPLPDEPKNKNHK